MLYICLIIEVLLLKIVLLLDLYPIFGSTSACLN